MPSKEQAAALNEVIAICRDGVSFYEDAAARVNDGEIKAILEEMAELRRDTIEELAPFIEETGEGLRESGTLEGATHHLLAGVQATFANNQTRALVAQLEELENRTIDRLQELVEQDFLPQTVPDATWEAVRTKLELFKNTKERIVKLRQALDP